MKTTVTVILMGLLIAVSAIAQNEKQSAQARNEANTLAEVRSAIDKGNEQWVEGWAKGDPELLAALFAPDGVQLVGSGKIAKGRQQIRDRLRTAMQSVDPGVKVTVTTVNVWLDGDTAYETGKYRYESTEKGKPSVDEGRYVTIWKRQKDGSWKLTMDMGVPKD